MALQCIGGLFCLCRSVSGVPRSFLEGCLFVYLTASPHLQSLNSSRSRVVCGIHICSALGFLFCWSLLKLHESFLLLSPSGLWAEHLLLLSNQTSSGFWMLSAIKVAKMCQPNCVSGVVCPGRAVGYSDEFERVCTT